jgi:ribokinase
MGARGACWLQPSGERRLIPAPKVKPVDTVGAGDCFCGALAAELCGRDKPASNLETALRFAVAAASLKVTRPGAQAGIPRRFEVEKFLKKRR